MYHSVSVIIPIAGCNLIAIEKALLSIENQSFDNFDIICVIDEPNSSALKKFLHGYISRSKRSIKVLFNTAKIGISRSLNKGIVASHSKYIARMDADDIAVPTRLDSQFKYLEANPHIAILGMQAINVDVHGVEIGVTNKPTDPSHIRKYAEYACPIVHPTWFLRRDVYQLLGFYKDMSPAQDYDLICRALRVGLYVANLEEIGIYYTVNQNSVSRRNIRKTLRITNIIRDGIQRNEDVEARLDKELAIDLSIPWGYGAAYNLRNVFITRYTKENNKLIRYVFALLIGIISTTSPSLFLDSYSLYKLQKLKLPGCKFR